MEILYYDREYIYKTLAESLVIGGLPMNKHKATSEGLKKEIKEVEEYVRLIDVFKDYLVEKEDEEGRIYISIEEGIVIPDEYFKSMGKYYRRGKALGQVKSGSGHNCMYKGVSFNMIVEFPLYWLKQYERYHFTDIISSQSTMHKILEFDLKDMFSDEVDPRCIAVIEDLRNQYNEETDKDKKKEIWRRIINSLPDGFTMSMGITMNYLQALSIINQRKNHKLNEWSEVFVPFLLDLPLLKLLMIKESRD